MLEWHLEQGFNPFTDSITTVSNTGSGAPTTSTVTVSGTKDLDNLLGNASMVDSTGALTTYAPQSSTITNVVSLNQPTYTQLITKAGGSELNMSNRNLAQDNNVMTAATGSVAPNAQALEAGSFASPLDISAKYVAIVIYWEEVSANFILDGQLIAAGTPDDLINTQGLPIYSVSGSWRLYSS